MIFRNLVIAVLALFILYGCSLPQAGAGEVTPTMTIGEAAERMVEALLAGEGEPPSPAEMVDGLRAMGLLDCAGPAERARVAHPDDVVLLLVECEEAILIDFTANDLPAPDLYRPAFEKINGMSAEIDFQLVSLDLEAREYEWGTAGTVIAVIQQAGNDYTQAFAYSDRIRVDHQFHRMVNRILADNNSEHRLFRLYLTCEDCDTNLYSGSGPVDPHRVPIISLTSAQAQAIQEQRLLSMCCDDFRLLKTAEVEEAIAGFQSLGLLDGLGAAEYEQARDEVFRNVRGDGAEVLSVFDAYDDSILYRFDLETANFENPYEEALMGLAGVSSDQFQPTAIQDEWVYDQESGLSFELNGTRYKTTLSNWMEWLDPSFIATVNQALKEQGSSGQFYIVEGSGQDVSVIFLGADQARRIKETGLLSLVP
jgi:hypothetical protein